MNKFPGFCVTCQRNVPAGHGDLSRSASGAWVVTCKAAPAKVAPRPAAEQARLDRAAADLDAQYGDEPDPFDTADEAEAREDAEAAGPGAAVATYARLGDGSWGIRGSTDLKVGAKVTVRKRDGTTKTETVAAILVAGPDATIARIVPTAARGGSYAPRRRRTWDSPGGRYGTGCGYPGCDGVSFCDECSE